MQALAQVDMLPEQQHAVCSAIAIVKSNFSLESMSQTHLHLEPSLLQRDDKLRSVAQHAR